MRLQSRYRINSDLKVLLLILTIRCGKEFQKPLLVHLLVLIWIVSSQTLILGLLLLHLTSLLPRTHLLLLQTHLMSISDLLFIHSQSLQHLMVSCRLIVVWSLSLLFRLLPEFRYAQVSHNLLPKNQQVFDCLNRFQLLEQFNIKILVGESWITQILQDIEYHQSPEFRW